jgi:predicted Zn-dependent protease
MDENAPDTGRGGGDTDGYRAAVDALLDGRPADASGALEALAGPDAPVEVRLALAKSRLGEGRGAEALPLLEGLLADETVVEDPGFHAYLLLLAASADALDGRPEVALARAEAVAGVDPRMEHAARELKRRLQKGRPPAVRF